MDKLEMLNSFKQRFQENLNPSLESIKYCQNDDSAIIELQFLNNPEINLIDLKFMGGEIIEDNDRNDIDILPLFNPDADIVDNASCLLELDDYSLIMCLDDILNEDAIEHIVSVHKQTYELKKTSIGF
jgi:hypothetical protein